MKIKYLKVNFEDEKEATIKQIEDEKLTKIKQILLIASLSAVGLLAILTIVIIVFSHKLKKTKGKLIEARAEVQKLNSAHKKDLQIAAGLVSEGKLVLSIFFMTNQLLSDSRTSVDDGGYVDIYGNKIYWK